MESQLHELMQAITGEPPQRITVQAIRRQRARRRVITAVMTVTCIALLAGASAVLATQITGKGGTPIAARGPTGTLVKDITIPARTLNAVGAGVTYPHIIKPITGTPLKSNDQPEVLYIGTEYCSYCAAERWALAVALSRFGTFSRLHGIHTSTRNVYPHTATITFYKSSYTSKYVSFVPVEFLTVQRNPLQNVTPAEQALWTRYDAPPYIASEQDAGAIPFIDFGNKYMTIGSSYNLAVLAGKTWSQVGAALHDPSSAIAQRADGAANWITAAICKLTRNHPARACTPVVKSLERKL